MKYFILLFTIFSFQWATAGTETHGGDLIICYDRPLFKSEDVIDSNAQITKMELKDYWENKRESSYKFNPPEYKSDDDWSNIKTALFLLSRIDYERAERLEKRIDDPSSNSFPKLIEFVEEGELPEVDDASSVLNLAAGSNCYDRQLAVQKSGLGVGRVKIFISNKIFNRLDKVNRVGILLHELLLEDYLSYGSNFKRNAQGKILTNSIRFLNYLFVSNIYEGTHSYLEYLNILKENNLLYFNEIVFNLQGHLFKISKAHLANQYPIITATHLIRYEHLRRNSEYLELNYKDDHRRGHTRFSLNPNSTLTISLSDYTFKEAKILGPFEIHSSIFEGRTIQTIFIRNSNESYLKFFRGTNVSELTLLKNSDFYCESKDSDDKTSFRKTIEKPNQVFNLSSPEYINPCDRILR